MGWLLWNDRESSRQYVWVDWKIETDDLGLWRMKRNEWFHYGYYAQLWLPLLHPFHEHGQWITHCYLNQVSELSDEKKKLRSIAHIMINSFFVKNVILTANLLVEIGLCAEFDAIWLALFIRKLLIWNINNITKNVDKERTPTYTQVVLFEVTYETFAKNEIEEMAFSAKGAQISSTHMTVIRALSRFFCCAIQEIVCFFFRFTHTDEHCRV